MPWNGRSVRKSEEASSMQGLQSPDPLVREAFLMAHDYIDYVTAGQGAAVPPAPTAATAALRHAGDELLLKFPIFFRRWPRIFQDVTERSACPMLLAMLDEHFKQSASGGRQRDLAWSAVLSVYVLAGQMALHCHERGMQGVLPELKECVGQYVERVICPELRDKGGWSGFIVRFSKKQDLEWQVKKVCCWTLLLLTTSILSYFLWKRRIA
ncbi:BCL2 like 16 [Anguilla anguilla]|uniref:BCL2 like 16 n=1 Tax=Anguilla anguilla TaxID=7936 RepID=UPI0015B23B43|nr:BCL2 like 16 [Anguilla anguilla]XP_035235856.1 BCL2 like 16 [Anguilla anguilla]